MGAKQDHPLSFQLSSCNNLSPLQHSAGDTDCSPEGITIKTAVCPWNKLPDCSSQSQLCAACDPDDKQDYAQIPCSFSLATLSLELPWSGGPWMGAGKRAEEDTVEFPSDFTKRIQTLTLVWATKIVFILYDKSPKAVNIFGDALY